MLEAIPRRWLLPALAAALLVAGCSGADDEASPSTTTATTTSVADAPGAVPVTVAGDEPVATVDDRFLSVGLDQAQLLGGTFWAPDGERDLGSTGGGSGRVDPYDLDRPPLVALLRELAPAYLRVGGTASDEVFYDLDGDPSSPPTGYDLVLDRDRWREINEFAADAGFDLTMTLNGGPGPRDDQGRWQPDGARALVEHTVEEGYPVAVWSLGNEPNYYGINFDGPDATAFAADYATFTAMVDEADPEALVAGPSSAYWPDGGEVIEVTEPFLAAGGGEGLDVITWHYYPQQSSRCAFARTPADPERALDPAFLDEVAASADEVEDAVDRLAPDAQVWLQETGNAQCGGQVGLSDRFAGTFWWLDQLGQLAARGQQVVVRWNVSGADYGLLREPDLSPNPDYWASVLWRRLMGTRVLGASAPVGDDHLRTYAHCHPDGDGAVTVLVANLDRDEPATVGFGDLAGRRQRWLLSAPDLAGREVDLNGERLRTGDDGSLPDLAPAELDGSLELPPATLAFVGFPDADVPACRS